jgi:hypothetical protein
VYGIGKLLRAGVLGCVLALTICGHALASGTAVNVGTPFTSGPPSVAVDNTGNAVIAWANTKDLGGASNFVQWCVLPVAATACTHSGNLMPAGGAQFIDGVHVLIDGSTVVILADVFGAATQSYEPLQEWQSTDGGQTFAILNGGKSVAEGFRSADTVPLNGVIVPGTSVLGFGWDTAAGAPSFNAFPLAAPPECSAALTTQCPFATLEPNTNPDQLSNQPGQFASQSGATPGVLGIFFTDFTSGPLGCSNAQTVPFGMAYAYASGAQSPTNDYNTSPGQPNSAWNVPLTQGDCNVDYQAVAGGPAGFGVLEADELTGTTVYHPFDQATLRFDTPPETVAATKEQSPSLSQDGAGGLYATFLQGGAGGPIALAYSGNGGVNWRGPTALNPNTDTNGTQVSSAVNPTGQGWATWIDNGSIFAQPFTAADAAQSATAIATTQTSGKLSGAEIAVPAGTVGEKDQASLSGQNTHVATGTMTYSLYSKSDCSAGSKVFSSTTTVSGGAASASAPVTSVLNPGTYYWVAAYPGDFYNAASASTCGAEKLTVGNAATIGGTGTSSSNSVTITVSCATLPCTVTITITISSNGMAGDASAAKAKAKTIKLATGKFKLTKKGAHKLTLKLTHAGKRFRKTHHGTLEGTITVLEKIHGHKLITSRKIKIKPGK